MMTGLAELSGFTWAQAVAASDQSVGYSGSQRTSAMRAANSSSLRLGATPSATACRPTASAIFTAMSGTSDHAGSSGASGSVSAGDASPRLAAAARIISSVTRVACAAVTASPIAGKM